MKKICELSILELLSKTHVEVPHAMIIDPSGSSNEHL